MLIDKKLFSSFHFTGYNHFLNRMDTFGIVAIIVGDMMQMVKNIPNAWGKFWKRGFRTALLSKING